MEELGDIDAIANSVEASTNNEIPMGEQTPTPEAAPPAPQEYEFESGGQKIKAPIDKILRWASMGHSAPNKIGELSKKLSDFESKSKEWANYEKTYKPIDEWARQNPDKWQTLFRSWQQAQYGVQPQGQVAPQPNQLPPELIQKINQFEERFQQQDQERTVQRERQADQGLDGEIQSIRKQFSNLDFDAPDESGNSLEYQILKHATENGIPSFRAAFRDYCFDKLNQFSETKGLEKGQKAISQKTKAGLLGKDQAPGRGRPQSDLTRNLNHDQTHEFIKGNLASVLASL